MDPITGIGAAASIVQLLGLAVQTVTAAKRLWESYGDAPKELRQLAEQTEFLRYLMEQMNSLGAELSRESFDELLPVAHRAIILATLHDRAAHLDGLRSLQGDHSNVRSKLIWALLDKARAGRVVKNVLELGQAIDTCLAIVQT